MYILQLGLNNWLLFIVCLTKCLINEKTEQPCNQHIPSRNECHPQVKVNYYSEINV